MIRLKIFKRLIHSQLHMTDKIALPTHLHRGARADMVSAEAWETFLHIKSSFILRNFYESTYRTSESCLSQAGA